MKNLELSLNKRLLIVEYNEKIEVESILDVNEDFDIGQIKGKRFIAVTGNSKFLCKGSELNEEIAVDLVNIFDLSYFVDYNGHSPRCYVDTAIESFISAIESKGWYWGQNPEGKSRPSFNDYSSLISYQGDCSDWDKAESRAFTPEKCLIFEIV